MQMKTVVTNYITECLKNAQTFKEKEIVRTFEMQAFGAVNLYARLMWNFDEDEQEAWIIREWNENWSKLFAALY